MEEFKDKPFVLLGINTDASRSALKEGLEKHKITWPVIYDGPPGEGISNTWNILAYPTVYLIDHKGVIHSRGEYSLRELVAKAMAEAE